MLDVPDCRMQTEYDCGDCVIRSVCGYYGLDEPAALSNASYGLAPDTLEAVLRSLDLKIISGHLTTDDLRWYTAGSRPVICPVTGDDGVGHWVITRGVYRRYVYLQDPAVGPTRVKLAWWNDHWFDSTRTTEYTNYGVIPWQ